jgi:hypothetical protein
LGLALSLLRSSFDLQIKAGLSALDVAAQVGLVVQTPFGPTLSLTLRTSVVATNPACNAELWLSVNEVRLVL